MKGPFRAFKRKSQHRHSPNGGLNAQRPIASARVESEIYGVDFVAGAQAERKAGTPLSDGAMEALQHMAAARKKIETSHQKEKPEMTVSLYTSTASGKNEIVVQTNAQSLDLFIAGLADAVCDAIPKMEEDARVELFTSLFRNAFPVAFAIAGYKAEKVVESRMLICGTAAPEKSSLLAHSRS